MSDRDVEREIEENQARARDTEDVGLDENVIRQRENEQERSNIVDDLADAIRGRDETEQEQVEYRPNRDTGREYPG